MQSSEHVGQTFHWVRRIHQTEMFEVWDGQTSSGQPTVMVLVTPGAIDNQAARASFVDAVRWAQRPDVADVTVFAEDAIGVKPWAALAADPPSRAFAERLVAPPVPQMAPPVSPVGGQWSPGAPPGSPMAPPGSPVGAPWSPGSPPGSPVVPSQPNVYAPPLYRPDIPAQPTSPPTPQSFAHFPVPPPAAAQPTSGPPTSGPPTSGPPTSGPPTSGPPTSGPPAAQPASGPVPGSPAPGSPASGPPASPWGQPPDTAQPPSVPLPWGPQPPSPAFGGGDPPANPGQGGWPTLHPTAPQHAPAQPVDAHPGQRQAAPQPWDGQAAPVRPPHVPPLPGPAELAERRRRRSRARLRTGVIAAVVLVLAGAATAAAFVLPGRATNTGSNPRASASPSPSPSPTPSPRPTFQQAATPVAVLGGSWQPGEATKVQDFEGWPFAFRTPADATCEFFVGDPGYKAHNCKWGAEPNHTVMAFVVRRCVNSCDATEQAQFETMTPWKPDGALAVTDPTTKFVNVDYGDGREQFTMLHYFGPTPGAAPEWVVMVQGNSAKQTRDSALKTMNDVRSQTP